MSRDLEFLKSCIICRTNEQNRVFESLLQLNKNEICLSEHGQLYQELFGLHIDLTAIEFYPHFVCSNCELQMKLFRQLKLKAIEAHTSLQKDFNSILKDKASKSIGRTFCQVITNEELFSDSVPFYDISSDLLEEETFYLKKNTHIHANEKNLFELDGFDGGESVTKSRSLKIIDNIDDIGNFKTKYKNLETDVGFSLINSDDSMNNVELNREYTDVQYLDEIEESSSVSYETSNSAEINKFIRTFRCVVCDTEFKKRIDFVKHRKDAHDNKYQCLDCKRILKTSKALTQHKKIHMGVSQFKCELCSKYFNQKVHFQYHMDKHNNIRKFKCEFCAKSYLSRADLNVHTRIHTNDRRYICDICGKDFLLFQHLKMHSFRHIGKKFECHICHQMLISPCTLQTHIKTKHTKNAKYKCNLCSELFHRKHTFDAHFQTHEHDKPVFEILPAEQLYKDEHRDELVECIEVNYAAQSFTH
ncbi:zinc finger protein 1 homolog [Teleopsis dalmanni]|uniref:zinc finger protein 1 homolog n=1 Tax=Teleopsis dalmanni TaxID=139649 RepID=UPI0018CDBF9A|nr:zinc finger protein 1 homolog [Teleopsis dalmanni]